VLSRSTMLRFAFVTPVTGFAMLIACSSGNAPNKLIDASTGSDGSANHDGSSAACILPASYTTPTFTSTGTNATESATNEGSGSGYTEELFWEGQLGGTGSAQGVLAVIAFSGGGSGSNETPDWPTGDVTAKSNLDLATDGDVLVQIAAEFNGSGMDPMLFYAAEQGTLNITTASPNSTTAPTTFAGSASGLTFVHVDVDTSTGAITGNDPDGCMATMPSFTFSAPVTAATARPLTWPTRPHVTQSAQ
jgi:hypothetical protein